jgi:DNA-binding MarR family transcriptional regulator
VEGVESELGGFSENIAKLKRDLEQGRISDLILLERLQKVESRTEESLDWIRKLADRTVALKNAATVIPFQTVNTVLPRDVQPQLAEDSLSVVVSPSGQVGSIRSLTTPTEMSVLALLGEQGAKSAPEIGRSVGRSREHTARLMKRLMDEGYVLRDQSRIPYRYTLSERVKQGIAKNKPTQQKRNSEETVSTVPST